MYTPDLSLSPEDREIEYHCYCLDEALKVLRQCLWNLPETPTVLISPSWSRLAEVRGCIKDAIAAIEREIGQPDTYTLYTADDVSLAYAVEDLANAKAKLAAWEDRVQSSRDYAYGNLGGAEARRRLQRDVEARDRWQCHVGALKGFIAANPVNYISF